MRQRFLIVIVAGRLIQLVSAQSPPPSPRLMIPDEVTAIRVGEAIVASTYNIKTMEGERPYKANLSRGVWHVWGTVPKDALGETVFVDINQKDGCILRVGAH